MSTATTAGSVTVTPGPAPIPDLAGAPGVPFARLVRLESRKVVDTRSGRWLLVTIAALVAVALGLVLRFGEPGDLTFGMLVAVTSTVLLLLYPVLGILTVTAETSQRTALVTYAVEPRRWRVVAAKVVAASWWAALGLAVAVALGAAAHGIAVLTRDVPADWSPAWASLGGFALSLLLAVLQGIAFGLLLSSPALAVSAYFVLPVGWVFVANLTPGLRRIGPWLDPSSSGEILVRGAMTGTEWAHLATSNALWVALPLAVGLAVLSRREVK
ncbi:ABC transporter permease [Kineosporia sp. A_224]|uniref:ABC transporter permease n=1 Tax=Kineosporia sp. A_224 TaxID=1962180 RepID=UPI000B4BF5C9|nr:ABC transporter permease [Kineosporia sp. A_224]